MFIIKNPEKSFSVGYPTSIGEITSEYFDKILSNVKLQEHYCIIALCFKEKVSSIALSVKESRNTTSNVVPIIAKIAKDNECGFEQMEKAVIDRTNLERGIHLPINNNWIGVAGFENYVKSNPKLLNSLIKGDYWKDKYFTTPEIYLVEFKIVPIRDIVASRNLIDSTKCIYTLVDKDAEKVLN